MRYLGEDEIWRLPLPPEVMPKTIYFGSDERDYDCGGSCLTIRVMDMESGEVD